MGPVGIGGSKCGGESQGCREGGREGWREGGRERLRVSEIEGR